MIRVSCPRRLLHVAHRHATIAGRGGVSSASASTLVPASATASATHTKGGRLQWQRGFRHAASTSSPRYEVTDNDIATLAKLPQHRLGLADLVRHGRPPLSEAALLSSANFALSLLPIRLAHRLQALRNLPYIVMSNPNVSRIYRTYLHSLSILLPYWRAAMEMTGDGPAIATLDDEVQFTHTLAELVATHTDTIPVLARGFLECRRYMAPEDVTRFLDEHLRARIGTRLVAEQHIALHHSSQPHFDARAGNSPCPSEYPTFVGVIDTALRPATLVDSCAALVADICELRYGVRPELRITGEPDTTFASVPMHLEYILTELLKNAFRATIENGLPDEPVIVTIAPEPPLPPSESERRTAVIPNDPDSDFDSDAIRRRPPDHNAPGVTIRIRDRGGGIPPSVLPNIWSHSFTTFSDEDRDGPGADMPGGPPDDGFDLLSTTGPAMASSIAGLGYGLPLSRAYAEYFGGGINVQTLYRWGTDVYLRLNGIGKIDDKGE